MFVVVDALPILINEASVPKYILFIEFGIKLNDVSFFDCTSVTVKEFISELDDVKLCIVPSDMFVLFICKTPFD